ncbi:hypothetical protein LCGC14_1189380 [marine sediment metagenome]|uniref:Uncharacterized protein n=1 Tax=marine sediment metagenome TaxID=412755 RepID=A0A0F9P2M5_9ZZZZ
METEQVIQWAAAIVLGLIGAPTLLDFLKQKLNLEGLGALGFALVASFGLGGLGLAASGAFAGFVFTADTFFEVGFAIFSAAQVSYRVLNPEPQS